MRATRTFVTFEVVIRDIFGKTRMRHYDARDAHAAMIKASGRNDCSAVLKVRKANVSQLPDSVDRWSAFDMGLIPLDEPMRPRNTNKYNDYPDELEPHERLEKKYGEYLGKPLHTKRK